jgi:hypothetical protein
MAIITMLVGDILVALGLITFFMWKELGAEHQSITALIPAFLGGALNILGGLAMVPKFRMHAMHLAVMLGLIGFLAAAGRLIAKPQSTGTLAGKSVIVMLIVTGIYVALCIRSFIIARRNRRAESVNP